MERQQAPQQGTSVAADGYVGTKVVVAAAVTAGAGVLGGRLAPSLGPALALGCLIAMVAVVVLRRRPAALVACVTAMGMAAGANAAWRYGADAGRLTVRLAAEEAFVHACGVVRAERPRSSEVELQLLKAGGSVWQVRESVLLVGDEARDVRSGERVCVEGMLRFPRPSAADEPTAGLLGRSSTPAVFLVGDNVDREGIGSRIRWAAGRVRHRFAAAATTALSDDRAGLLLAMTTGNRTLLDEATMEAFRTTGLAHLVAVSGFHVAVVLGLVMALMRLLIPFGRWVRAAAAVPPLVFFAFLVGLTPSVLRATVMAGIVLAIVASGRTSEGLRVAGFAFIALVFASPDLLFQPGFQMSFGATIGLILWARPLSDRLAGLWRRPKGARPAKAVAALSGTALAAQLGVAPLLALHFGQVPAAGGLANLVAVPLAPLVVGGGIVTLSLASLWDWLSWAPSLLLLPLDVILAVARWFSRLPGASFHVGLPIAAALTLLGAGLLTRAPKARAACLAIAFLLAVGGGGGRVASVRISSCPQAEIRALDVGGTAVLMRAGGAAILGDGGPRDGGIVDELRALGVGRLDAIVASHPHADHTEGLVEVVRHMRVGAILAPGNIGWGSGRDLVEAASAKGVPLHEVTSGQVIRLGPQMSVEVLWPDPGPLPDESPNLIGRYNLVVRAEVAGVGVLLPGDADGLSQMLLAPRTSPGEVFVAVHHGSADVDGGFVDAASPELTLVTVARGNPYGHPKAEALALYERYGDVLRTDTDGHVVICVQDGRLEARTSR